MISDSPEESQRRFTREVIELLIAQGLHPARAEAAVEKGLRFLQLNTGAWVARVIADHGPLATWQDGAANVLLKDIDYYAPIEQPKAHSQPRQAKREAAHENGAEAEADPRSGIRSRVSRDF